MTRNLPKFLAFFMFAFMALAGAAYALSLADARSKGLVGEQQDGYVAAINQSSEVRELVADINARRTAEYTRIAKENGQTIAVVGKLAAPKIISGLPKGALYKDDNGAWATR